MSTEADALCCACGTRPSKNLVMLPWRGPQPGKGWGCVICDLPCDGAVAIWCEACAEASEPIREVCAGYAGEPWRVPLTSLTEPYEHDMSLHVEED